MGVNAYSISNNRITVFCKSSVTFRNKHVIRVCSLPSLLVDQVIEMISLTYILQFSVKYCLLRYHCRLCIRKVKICTYCSLAGVVLVIRASTNKRRFKPSLKHRRNFARSSAQSLAMIGCSCHRNREPIYFIFYFYCSPLFTTQCAACHIASVCNWYNIKKYDIIVFHCLSEFIFLYN